MPAGGGLGLAQRLEIVGFLGFRQGRPFARIETDGDDLEIPAGRQLERPDRLDNPVQRQVAEHRAAEIDLLNSTGRPCLKKSPSRTGRPSSS